MFRRSQGLTPLATDGRPSGAKTPRRHTAAVPHRRSAGAWPSRLPSALARRQPLIPQLLPWAGREVAREPQGDEPADPHPADPPPRHAGALADFGHMSHEPRRDFPLEDARPPAVDADHE